MSWSDPWLTNADSCGYSMESRSGAMPAFTALAIFG